MPKKQSTAQKKARALVNSTDIPYVMALKLTVRDASSATQAPVDKPVDVRVVVTYPYDGMSKMLQSVAAQRESTLKTLRSVGAEDGMSKMLQAVAAQRESTLKTLRSVGAEDGMSKMLQAVAAQRENMLKTLRSVGAEDGMSKMLQAVAAQRESTLKTLRSAGALWKLP
ncbi:hypothetical protein [Streptomyces hokutonensis]|uniref:hypothetical protein n=1 Tax=Streptomyces hokutonensis TaxID=1306990 RepID=UPI0003771FE9|nr:hypothetical protein [Streptomyces hokutonensis]